MFKRVNREEITLPADVDHLGEMRDFITRIGRKYGVSERVINAFKLALDEAATNVIRHAYRDWEGNITIQMIVRDKSVTVTLVDQGHTFDPNNVKDPDLKRYVDIGKKGGLGIFIIRRVIDDIDYRKTVHGNELRLTKERDITPLRGLSMPDLSFTMKTRFSLLASGVLSLFIIAAFLWNFFQINGRILTDNLNAGRAVARSMANQCLDHLVQQETWELARISAEIQREYAPLLMEALVVDNEGMIQGALQTDFLLQPYIEPASVRNIEPGVSAYHLPGIGEVLDVHEFVVSEASDAARPVGSIHLLISQAVVDDEIRTARRDSLVLFGTILILGYFGVFILVYMTMSPFKKLSQWIRELGQGEVKDEIDFDVSDEVGEIAQAFNEITAKFRKSQVNLAEQERLQKEMQVAQEIQQTLLPASFPDIEGYEIASYYEAAKEVGGDYFDFVEVDRDTLGIVVADVSGKGVPGSLVMTMIRTALRTEARGNKNAADVLARVNDFVLNDMKRGMFVTIFYIILDSKNRTINYASAGHNPMILYRSMTSKSYYLNPRGFPIGISLPDNSLFRTSIQSDTLRLQEGDVLVIYTDGITEAMNPIRDKFGDERFLSALRQYGHLQVDPLVDKIRDEINIFTEGYAQNDDITLVSIREKMKAEDVLFNMRSRLMKMVNEEGMHVKDACKAVGVSTSTYYKYKRRFEKMGDSGLKELVARSEIEEKHISIEDKAKIFDIIKNHPEYGAKRISEELKKETYGFVEMDDRKIYDELVQSRLNTKELRLTFVERGPRKKRMKPPGTPFLTLDGKVIVNPEEQIASMASEESGLEIPEVQKSVSGIRVSQRSPESLEVVDEEQSDEKQQLLESFLGLSETDKLDDDALIMAVEDMSDEEAADDEVMAIGLDDEFDEAAVGKPVSTDKVSTWGSFSDLLTHLEEYDREEEDDLEEISETEDILTDLPEEPESDFTVLDEENLQIDEALDAFIFNVEHDSEMEASTDEESETLLRSILDLDEFSALDGSSRVEEQISTSVVEDLLDEDLSLLDIDGTDALYKPSQESKNALQDVTADSFPPDDADRTIELESGLNFYRHGQYEDAVQAFEIIVDRYPEFPEGYQCLGDAYFRMGRLEEAMKAYERVKRLDPGNVNVMENLGVIFANRGEYKKAVWQWGEVLKYNPERLDIINRIKRMQRVIRQRYL